MRHLLLSAITGVLFAASGCTPEKTPSPRHAALASRDTATTNAAICGDPTRWGVSDSAIGPIRVGAAANSVLHLCPGTVDSLVRERDMESVDTVRVLFVPVGARDAVQVTIERGEPVVGAIAVRTGPFRTADSLGIGTPVTRWRAIPGVRVLYGDHSDDGVLVVPSHCGISFGISGEANAPDDRVADAGDLATWPETVRITSIMVSACSRS